MGLITFKVTVEYTCPNMIDEESFRDEFDSNPMAAYKFISGNFEDNVTDFSRSDQIVKVEVEDTDLSSDNVQ